MNLSTQSDSNPIRRGAPPATDLRISLEPIPAHSDGPKIRVQYNLRLAEPPTPDEPLFYMLQGQELAFETVVNGDLEHDLEQAKLRFLNKIHTTYDYLFSANGNHISQKEHDDLLHELRATGRSIFDRLIGNPPNTSVPDDDWQLAVEELHRCVRSKGKIISIDWVRSSKQKFLFPWGCLYDTRAGDARPEAAKDEFQVKPHPDRFWGFRHQLHENRNLALFQGLFPPTCIVVTVDDASDTENIHASPDHPLSQSDPLYLTIIPADSSKEVMTHLSGAHVYYYFGNCKAEHGERELSWTPKSLQELQRLKPEWLRNEEGATDYRHRAVLLFLNGCGTSNLDALEDDTIIGSFCGKHSNKVHVVATVGKMASKYAARFAKLFMKHFLLPGHGNTVGEAILEARISLLKSSEEDGLLSPLGLLYVVCGLSQLRIAVPNVVQVAAEVQAASRGSEIKKLAPERKTGSLP
jgi:hypothetical protein